MHTPSNSLPKTLAGLIAALCVSSFSALAVDVPANVAIGGPLDHPGGHLKGEYWHRGAASILTDGAGNRANGVDNQIKTFGPADGTFSATKFVYLGNDLDLVKTWLSVDAASFVGTTNNLDDGAFRFTGYINRPAAGVLNIGTISDDGSRVTIGGIDVINNDGSHGDATVDADVNFLAAGLYPIEITYFAGDWTSDGNNHSGSPDPGLHGGDNFHFRVAGADITPDAVAAMFHPPAPPPMLLWAVGKDDNGWPVGDGGGPNATFVQENGTINPLPGSPNSPEVDQQADNDYYFAGLYSTVIPGNGSYVPVGFVAANEEAAERAFAGGDLNLRYHFNLPNTLQPFDQLSVSFDANNLDDLNAVNTDPRFGVEIYINNVLVQTQILIRPAQLDHDYTSTPVTLASVNARVGPGYDNIVSLRGISYNAEGGGNWMGVDYVQLNASSSPSPLLAVGLNFGADEPNGAGSSLADTDVAGALPQAHWNNLTGASGNASALVEDAAGIATPTTISVTWSSPNTWSSTGRGEENNGFPPGADHTLMTGYIDTGNTDGTKATVTVSGIPTDFTSGGYDVLVYGLGGVAGRGGAYTINGETKFGTSPANPAAHAEDPGVDVTDTGTYVRFRGQFGSSFTLTSSADPALGGGVNFRAPINAIQIVKSQDPDAGLVRGYLTKLRYDNLGDPNAPGTALSDLLTHPKYVNNTPDVTCLRTDFSENDANECNNCGYSVRGFFIPKTSGPHTFYMASDDGGGLFLSTDDNPANKVQIASEPAWTFRRNYVGGDGDGTGTGRGNPPSNISAPINLIAGVKYYIEGAVKEGGGGDNLDVAVQGPGDPAVADGDRPIFGDRIATKVDLTGSSLAITQNPASVQVPEGDAATFTVAVAASSPLCGGATTYQWQRKGSGDLEFTDIPGANAATYTFGPVRVEDHQAQYRAVVKIPGLARTSAPATLEVLGRDCLRVVAATGSGDFTHVVVSFSTFINQTDVATTDAFNYTVATAGSVVTGLRFTTANDSPARDPMTFTLEGTSGDPATGPWKLIASGNTGLDTARLATAPDVHFPNTAAYLSYRLLFPTVRDAVGANSMQIAEVSFLDAANNDISAPGNTVIGVHAIAGSPTSDVATAGTVANVNNYPAAESPDKIIDDSTATKYLNFAKLDTGVIVTPAAGPASFLTVSSVALGGDRKSVILTTDAQAENALFTVTVENVQSLVGSPVCPSPTNQATFRSFVSGCGGGILETYPLPGGGVAVDQLRASPLFPNSPDFRGPISSFDIRVAFDPANPSFYSTDARENYGGRLRGEFIAPETGPHTFYFSSDDNGELWLSTDQLPSHKVLIAKETVWSNTKQWTASGGGSALGVGGKKSAPINLEAGHAYYIEALYHEGGGGDNAAVAVQVPSQATPPAEGADAIPGRLLGASAPAGLFGDVTVSQQPASQTLAENATATFTVGVNAPTIEDFPLPVCYQWSRDGVAITGATGPTYSFGPVTLADDGARFSVAVSSIGTQATSQEAVLHVISDVIRPTCVSASAALSLSNIIIRFSEPIKPDAAQDTFSFSVPGFNVVSAALAADQMTITIGLDGLMSAGGTYNVTIGGVEDLAGNLQNPNPCTLTFTAPSRSCGFTLKELYLGLSASTVAIADLRASPKYPASPDLVRYGEVLELNTFDEFEGYGARLSGWLRPPVTGNYTFYLASDDNGELWLSTDDSPANIVNIANEPVWSSRRSWTGEAGGGGRIGVASPSGGPQANISGPIPLVAGRMYYYEALVKEGGGGDNLAVAWQIPGQPPPANGSTPIPGTYLASLADPAGASINITRQPCPNNICLPVPGIPPADGGGVLLSMEDFSGGNGGYTVANNGAVESPWAYDGANGRWTVNGSGNVGTPTSSALTSPAYTITSGGNGELRFDHRYSFEYDGTRWDGGQIRVSVNGGAFVPINGAAISANGYNGSVQGNNALTGQSAFTAESAGYPAGNNVTTVANLGCLNAGDTVRVQFLGAWDEFSQGPLPNWVIDKVTISQAVAGGGTASFTVGGTGMITGNTNVTPFIQWQRSVAGGAYSDILGATGPDLTFTPTLADNGNCYRAVFYVPGATATSSVACLTVNQGNTPPSFTCGTNQSVLEDSGPQTVPGWATGISPDSINATLGSFNADFSGVPTPATVTNLSDFSSLPAGAAVGGNAAISGGVLHLTDAVNSQQGSYVTPSLGGSVDSFTVTFKVRVGGGTCCGARTADGWSFNYGQVAVPVAFPVGAEEGAGGANLTVSFDSWDNTGVDDAQTAPDADIKVGGAVLAYQAFAGEREGGRAPSGPFINDPATGLPMSYSTGNDFATVRIHLDADGTLDVDFKGVRIFDNVPTGLTPVANPRIAFGARTGGANDNHWIDDLEIVTTGVQAVPAPAGSTLYGNAYINDGRLHLTDAANNQIGSFIVNDLLGGTALGSFTMTFDALVGQGTAPPADGFSVSVGSDIPNAPISEEGEGTGLRVAFDSFDNGGGEAPAIDVYWNGVVIAHTPVPQGLETGGQFVPVSIKLDPDGTLDVVAAGTPVYTDLATGYIPIAGARFALGGRTGGLNENNWIDNLHIAAVAVNPGDAEVNQTVQFMVTNDNPGLFSSPPAISPNGTLTYTPAPDACGSAHVSVVAKDNGGTGVCGGQDTSAACVFTIDVACLNDCPIANAQSVTTVEDAAVGITLTGSDPEGNALTFSINTSPAHGTLSGTPPNVIYIPAPDYCGPDGFTFRVNDGECVSTGAVTIAVNCANDCPTAGSFAVTVNAGASVPVPLVGADPDGNPLTFSVTPPSHGTLSGTAPNLTYTPAAGYSGPDSFTYTVNDGQCTSPPATVSITVRATDQNSCPVAHIVVVHPCAVNSDNGLIILSADNEEGCVIFDGTGSTDANGDRLTYAWYLDSHSTPFARGAVVSNCFDLDSHTVTLVVNDGKCTGSDSIQFEIVSACEAVESLIHDVNHANLSRKNKRPLLASLKAACASFERENSSSGVNQLEAFQSKVRAQISHSNPADAARFIQSAQSIIDAIKCAKALEKVLGDRHDHDDDDDDDNDDHDDHGNNNDNGHHH